MLIVTNLLLPKITSKTSSNEGDLELKLLITLLLKDLHLIAPFVVTFVIECFLERNLYKLTNAFTLVRNLTFVITQLVEKLLLKVVNSKHINAYTRGKNHSFAQWLGM